MVMVIATLLFAGLPYRSKGNLAISSGILPEEQAPSGLASWSGASHPHSRR
ncbi:MAG: hypothetical protein RIE56_10235 [Amphiplicatus sp.]